MTKKELLAEIRKLEAKLWVANDTRLRTYDGLTDKADKYDELIADVTALLKAVEFSYNHLESMDGYSVVYGARHAMKEAMDKWNEKYK
jgi:hypothetical protein